MASFARDMAHGFRLLRQQPGFALVALFAVALGIGATTAIFSVVNAVILRPLPIADSHRLVLLFETNARQGWNTFNVAPANFVDWARRSTTFQSISAFQPSTAAVAVDGDAEQVPTTFASAEFFTVLRGTPVLGRGFAQGDDAPGAAPIAVIGHGLWQRRFGGDASVVGRIVTVNDRPTTIVGVMEAGFGRGSRDTSLWLPLTIDRARAERGGRTLTVVGRLADAATLDQARHEMLAIAEHLSREFPTTNGEWGVNLVPLEQAAVSGNVRRALTLLLGAVVFVLLIACVNVANLLSARGVARQRELAVRAALGAGRWRLARQLLAESVALAAVGGLLGVFVAIWGTKLLLAVAPPTLPRIFEVDVDGRVLGAALAATLLSATIFGLVPALLAMSPRLNENLKDTTRHGTETPGRRRVGRAFVVVQIGLAVVLLICSGLLVRSFVKLSNQPIGFEPENSLVFSLGLPESKYPTPESVTQFYGELLRRLRTVPGVVAVGGTHAVPLSGANSVRPFIREGDAPGSDAPTSEYRLITPGYFAAMGIPVTRGRDFNDSDGAGRPGAIIVSESFARRHLRNRDPLGQRIRQGGDNPEIPWLTVVGVVGDVRHFGLGADVQPEMFWPEAQATWGATLNRLRRSLNIVVRTTDSPEGLVPAIRSHIAAMDPNRPMIDARPLRTVVAQAADLQRFSMALVTVFAVVGLVLSMAGVYALSSYAVAVRRREIGIRLALGAEPRTVLVQVLRSGVTLAAAGAALGLLVAGAIGDWIQPQLFDTAPRDPATFAGVAAILLATALVASFVPARRASRVNPIEALRTD